MITTHARSRAGRATREVQAPISYIPLVFYMPLVFAGLLADSRAEPPVGSVTGSLAAPSSLTGSGGRLRSALSSARRRAHTRMRRSQGS
ncbi:MAG: hypothetical protein ACTHNT_11375 [Actinomycetales bacterium]